MGLLDRLFSGRTAGAASKEDAKSRLKVLLVHDQVDLTPQVMEAMKGEILEVIARYAEVDAEHVELRLERAPNGVSLVSSVPVRRVNNRPAVVATAPAT
jgi:cell division topological specificity factor